MSTDRLPASKLPGYGSLAHVQVTWLKHQGNLLVLFCRPYFEVVKVAMLWCKVVVTLVLLSVYLCSLPTADHLEYWESPGCHLVGFVKVATIPGCHTVRFHMNACRGYCLSYSILAPYSLMSGSRIFKSVGNCCSIQDTHDVIVNLQCQNNEIRQVTYRSAASCTCALCSIDQS
ncbi:thyrostimulin alpha-2 subunit-like [Acanthaster planci]|uniref:Thyrostimulin alpha-2 subunit-like n=1 Tax=Acanthaster planci TaxID=133434 RepID=A0A8B7Y360_ACAPL|nr:thyrostimulin alpha-2 subunit-like [Acanthaster planci]